MEELVSAAQPVWRGRRVFLTGATGLVGSWVLERLLEAHADPVCLVRDSVPQSRSVSSGALQRSTVVHGSVEDHDLVERALNEYEIEVVIHLAAQTIVTIANHGPLSTFESNIRGTWSLLEACRRYGRTRAIVVASSDKAYGSAPHLPYDEAMPLAGRHPYDVSKSCADLIAQSYAATYGLPVTVTRCGNFYGGGDLNWSRLIPSAMRSALQGERPVLRSDGTPRRDYLYAEDAATAYLLLAQKTVEDPSLHGLAFNFSNEDPRDVRSVVTAVLEATGRTDLEPVVLDDAPYEIQDQFLYAARARERLGWRPAFDLASGLRRTASWYAELLGVPLSAGRES